MPSIPQRDPDEPDTNCEHTNSVCVCNTADSERASYLQEYLDILANAGWDDVLLMPLDNEGKAPIIKDTCDLDTPEAREYLQPAEEAVEALQRGVSGFVLYAGREEHRTDGLVFTDHDEPDLWPPSQTPSSLRVRTGSGTGYHKTYRNTGDVQNAKAKDELEGTGEVRAENWFIVTPGSIHPSGGIYHIDNEQTISTLATEDLPRELRPRSTSKNGSESNDLTSIAPEDLDALPEKFNPNEVTNQWGVPLKDIRTVSTKTDRLLKSFNPDNEYPSPSEADMATVAMLLIWGFSEDDIADILRATRTREKMHRDDYVQRTISRTALTDTNRLDPDLGRALVTAAKQYNGRPPAHEATLMEIKHTLRMLGGEASVSQLVDRGAIDWRDANRESVMKRLRRGLKLLEDAGYVSKQQRGRGTAIWRDDGLSSLSLPHSFR